MSAAATHPVTGHRWSSIVVAIVAVAMTAALLRIVVFPGGVFAGYGSAVGMPTSVDGVALIGMEVRSDHGDDTLEISATARVARGSTTNITEVVVCHDTVAGTVHIATADQWSDLHRYCTSVEPARHASLGPDDSLVVVIVPLTSGTITIDGVDVTRHRFGRDISEHSGIKATIDVAG